MPRFEAEYTGHGAGRPVLNLLMLPGAVEGQAACFHGDRPLGSLTVGRRLVYGWREPGRAVD